MRAVVSVTLLALTSIAPARPVILGYDRIVANDNRVPAGRLHGNVLTLDLEARIGSWYPNGDHDSSAAMLAFAEVGRAPRIPGPLIRVRAGTVVNVSLRNHLANDTLVVHGLDDRVAGASPAATALRLLPGERRLIRFRLDAPGTYYYWGSTTGRDVNWRTGIDAQLTGAIVVDPVDAPPGRDRVLVIGMWSDTVARAYTERTRILAVINGRSWPYTERLVYDQGDTVRWRVINASGDNHPMHLHGFYFGVDSRGDGERQIAYRGEARDREVTESMAPGATMQITWVAERPGNWLFHCHIPEHIAVRGPLGLAPTATTHPANHAAGGMAGLVVGVEIRPTAPPVATQSGDASPLQRLRLLVRRNAGGSDSTPYYGFALQTGTAAATLDTGLRLGPPLVLERGRPVSITVVNALTEPTAVHWHGIELESYYDGVADFSGSGRRLAPIIAPGDSFEARFTPPHAGTFIYHTHVDELRQEPAGLAGPIIVLDQGARWDPATDHPVMITSPWSFEAGRTSVLVNGGVTPTPVILRVGVPHRLRIVNMTTRRPALRLELRRDTTLLEWMQVAKDGADLPIARRGSRPAVLPISIGETVDVAITPDTPGMMRLDVLLGGRLLNVHPVLGSLPLRVVAASADTTGSRGIGPSTSRPADSAVDSAARRSTHW